MRVTRSNISKKVFRLNDFRGVDYYSSPLEVKPYRATDMANFILRDGVLHKRNGWKRMYHALRSATIKNILNVWKFNDNYLIIRGYGETYNAEKFEEWSYFYGYNVTHETLTKIGSTRTFEKNGNYSQATAIMKNGALYIFCGGIVKIAKNESGQLELTDIGDVQLDGGTEHKTVTKRAYIPTTTINIIPIEAKELDATIWARTTNEYINILSPWRKNELIWEDSDEAQYYQLDGIAYQRSWEDYATEQDENVNPDNYGAGVGKFANSAKPTLICTLGTEDPVIIEFDFYQKDEETTKKIGYMGWKAKGYNIYLATPDVYKAHGVTVPGNVKNTSVLKIPAGFNPFWTLGDIEDKGYTLGDVKMTIEFLSQDRVYLASSGKGIGYPSYYLDALTRHYLSDSRHGIVFGANGADDRLFVAGVETDMQDAKQNAVYYSENNNFEYFPAINMIICGDESFPICAFEKISDGTLAVFKNVRDNQKVCVYYISGRYQSLGQGEEGNTYYVEIFSVSAGNINESGVSATSTYNFSGDSLFVSDNGVFGLVLSENPSSSERYARERSKTINSKLKEFDLTNSKAIVHDNKYYLAVGGENNEVYVADARYKYNTEGDLYGSYSYEWFRFTGIPVSTWFILNNELWFGTEDGWLCKFHDEFDDICETHEGDLLAIAINESEYGVVFNFDMLPLLKTAAYAEDENGDHWEIGDIRSYKDDEGHEVYYFPVPNYISVNTGAITLRFHIPIHAYWKSAIVDFDKSFMRKNLWSLSASIMPVARGRINMGYKTRKTTAEGIAVDGANAFNFGDVDFTTFSFDCGGFVNAYREKVFERGFIYLQLMFSSNSDGDAVVNELAVEYSEANNNIGVG